MFSLATHETHTCSEIVSGLYNELVTVPSVSGWLFFVCFTVIIISLL